MKTKKVSLFKRFISRLVLLVLLFSTWSCDDENFNQNGEKFIHSCRLQKSVRNFLDFTELDCSFILPSVCCHEYFYNENNVVYKRVQPANSDPTNLYIDSIAFDQMGRVISEYSFTRYIGGESTGGRVREYSFDNDTDMNPLSSELSFYDANGPYLSISSEEYIFDNGSITKLSLIVDGEFREMKSFEYDEQGNLKEIVSENSTSASSIIYPRYSDMINPIRDFPFRDQFGVSNSINMYLEVIAVSSSYSTGTWESNENGYPDPLGEYDCD